MKPIFLAATLFSIASALHADQVDLTNLKRVRPTSIGMQTWEFYDMAAIRYYEQGSATRFDRIGTGAYEKYDREGEWDAVFLFFDAGDGVQLRILSRPGILTREENRAAPMETGVFPFNAKCTPIWGSN